MRLLAVLKEAAVQRKQIGPEVELDLAKVFSLVRDMPYMRASDREPETLISEWRGTCSGKHYLLKELFMELGYDSDVIACTSVTPISSQQLPPELLPLWEAAGQYFVDVHNYLVLHLPDGDMIVDATWPQSASESGLVSNKEFVPGQDQVIACEPLETWVIPEQVDPQEFKTQILQKYFSADELAFREAFIHALGVWLQREQEVE